MLDSHHFCLWENARPYMLCWRGPEIGSGSLHSSTAMKAPALLSARFARSTCREWVSPCHSKVMSKHSVNFGLHENADP